MWWPEGRRLDGFEKGFERDDVLAAGGDFEEGAGEGGQGAERARNGCERGRQRRLEIGLLRGQEQRGLVFGGGGGGGGLERGRGGREQVERETGGRGAGFGVFGLGVRRRRGRWGRGGSGSGSGSGSRDHDRGHGELADRLLGFGAQFVLRWREQFGLERREDVHAVEVLAFLAGPGRGEELAERGEGARGAHHRAVILFAAGRRGGLEVCHLRLELSPEQQAAADGTSDLHGLPQSRRGHVNLLRDRMTLDDLFFEAPVALRQGGDAGLGIPDDALAGFRPGLRVGEEREGGFGGEGVDVGVDFLDVEEDARQRGGEVERGVGRIVRRRHERVGEGDGREGRIQEGFVVDVGGFRLVGGHGGELGFIYLVCTSLFCMLVPFSNLARCGNTRAYLNRVD